MTVKCLFVIAAAMSMVIAAACIPAASEQEDEDTAEVCAHKNWPGPDDDWMDYPYSSPFVKETPPPPGPPTVQMVVEDESGETFVDGVLFYSDWVIGDIRTIYDPMELDVVESMPWPDAADVSPPCHVRILANTLPSDVGIIGFAADFLDPVTGLPPDDLLDPWTLRYECGRFGDRVCVHFNEDGLVEIYPIPAPLLDLPYLIVFAVWPTLYEYRMEHLEEPGSVRANWLFQFPDK